MRQNLGELLITDWEKAPPYMKDHAAYLRNYLHELSDDAFDSSDGDCMDGELQNTRVKAPSLSVFVEIAKNLVSVARGKVEVSGLLLSFSLVQHFFEELLARFLDRRLVCYIDLIVHQTPSLRIIEVGAGQGAMAKLILSALE